MREIVCVTHQTMKCDTMSTKLSQALIPKIDNGYSIVFAKETNFIHCLIPFDRKSGKFITMTHFHCSKYVNDPNPDCFKSNTL